MRSLRLMLVCLTLALKTESCTVRLRCVQILAQVFSVCVTSGKLCTLSELEGGRKVTGRIKCMKST